MDKVAVLMSTYNGEKYLNEQIDSILAQDGVDVILYIRDDGSSDRTAEIIKWLSNHNKIQRRICWDGYAIEPNECLEIIEMLEKDGLYELIYILLMRNINHIVISEAIEILQAEAWVKEWEKIGNEQMCRNIKEQIKQGINLHKNDTSDML